jgi:glycosyltransferase involved in cell wall biosynthesis
MTSGTDRASSPGREPRLRVLFLTRTLRTGGSERQIAALARGLRAAGHEVAVAVFYGGGTFERELRAGGVPVHDLSKRGRWDGVPFLARVVRLVRRERPDVVHSYMDGPNIVAALLKRTFPHARVVWGLRSSMSDFAAYDWIWRVTAHVERLASPLADAIIANSEAARRRALSIGYDGRSLVVVPNGIDCEAFRPDLEGGARCRREWSIPDGAPVVGMVARLDPVKGHANFLRAAARVAAARPDVRFVCIGGGSASYRERIERLAADLDVASRLLWTGERLVTRSEYSAFDVAVLASDEGEGFPNAVAEAMACGTAVVATDSGDAAAIVGSTGRVVPTRDPSALASAILELLAENGRDRAGISARARARVAEAYSVEALVLRTTRVLERVRVIA